MLGLQARLTDGEELRPVAASDLDEMHAMVEANRAHLRPWMPWADQEHEATARFIETAIADAATDRALHLTILADGRIAGACGFNFVDWMNGATMIGYWLGSEFTGRGLMTRAVTAMLDHAFGDLSLHRLELRAATGNARSRAVAERLAFTKEGTLREAELVAGRHHDLILYSMLAADWRR